jgi:hypothetical protein
VKVVFFAVRIDFEYLYPSALDDPQPFRKVAFVKDWLVSAQSTPPRAVHEHLNRRRISACEIGQGFQRAFETPVQAQPSSWRKIKTPFGVKGVERTTSFEIVPIDAPS